MRQKMSGPSRQEVLKRCIDEYNQSSWLEKGDQLDQFVKLTGYCRKYLIKLLNNVPAATAKERRGRPAKYDEVATAALVQVWEASGCICSKRLVPFLPTLLDSLERFGHLCLPLEVRELLLSVSISTADRLLVDARAAQDRGLSTTKPNRIIRKQIALRTHNGWDDVVSGYLEVDLVAHCGGRVAGSYLYTLDLTDIVTGWTECLGLLDRRAETVVSGIKQVRARLPFALLGLDTDNGGEFINELMLTYCQEEDIEFTRSRAYKKNDQAHIEERNGSVVRRLVGYDRYDGEEACAALNELYDVLRLHQNYYQPSLRLISKEREGSHVTRRYDRAQTPLQRLLASNSLSEQQSDEQRSLFNALDPVHLLGELNRVQDRFWTFAWNCNGLMLPSPSITADKLAGALPPAEVLEPPVTETACVQVPAVPSKPLALTKAVRVKPPSQPVTPFSASLESVPTASLESVPSASLESAAKARRDYRRTCKPVNEPAYHPRGVWYTQIWEEIDDILQLNPYLSAERLMAELQRRHPGQFHTRQVRSLRRCVSRWRHAHPTYADALIPATAPRSAAAAWAKVNSPYIKIGFTNVWEDVKTELTLSPYQSVNNLFSALQRKYPGRFRDEQVGTFRNQLSNWRCVNPEYKKPSLAAFNKSRNSQPK
jgi:hypothetical protein